jgi:excisionase family DNA binding protein
MSDKMLSTSQVAERLGVNARTVQRWAAAGRFPGAYRLDPDAKKSPYLIPEGDVEAFEERRKRSAQP